MSRWLHGEQVDVYRREKIGEDDLSEPIYKWIPKRVDNVLVNPIYSDAISGDDLSSANRPDGMNIRYRLAFPKTFTDNLAHCKIVLVDRGMDEEDALFVTGSPDRLTPCPTEWNLMATVGRIDG